MSVPPASSDGQNIKHAWLFISRYIIELYEVSHPPVLMDKTVKLCGYSFRVTSNCIGQLKWSSFTLAQIHWGNLTQLNFSWRTDRGILYKYCCLAHASIYLVHVHVDGAIIRKRAKREPFPWHQSCYSPQGLAARSYVVNRLNTDLTTKFARCLRRRDDNRPTLSMTGTHAIANRSKTFCVKRYFQFSPLPKTRP